MKRLLQGSCLLYLFSLFSLTSTQAPGDENSYCTSTVNVNDPPDYRDSNRLLLFDTYNYGSLLERINSIQPAIKDATPVFQKFSLAGNLFWDQRRSQGNCRLNVFDCKITSTETNSPNSQNHWLVTQHIRVDRSVRELRVFLRFILTQCPPGTITACRDTFELYIVPSDADTVVDQAAVATYASNIPSNAHGVITGPNGQETSHYFEVDQASLLGGFEGFRIALQSFDACVTVNRIQVLYWVCPAGRQGLMSVDSAGEPQTTSSFQCVGNSTYVLDSAASVICTVETSNREESAEWIVVGGAVQVSDVCGCNPGFGLTQSEGEDVCTECPSGTFKDGFSSVACAPCPASSSANSSRTARCDCSAQHYRGDRESAALPCALPPSSPLNVTVIAASARTVTLSWNRPAFTGTRPTFFYTVYTRLQGSAEQWIQNSIVNASVSPSLNHTVLSLDPFVSYDIRVTADSAATEAVPVDLIGQRSQVVSATTKTDRPGPGSPPALSVPMFSSSITVNLAEQDMANGEIVEIRVRWYLKELGVNSSQLAILPGTPLTHTIDDLSRGTYIVQVQLVNSEGTGEFSEAREVVVEGVPEWLFIAPVAAVLAVVVAVAVIIGLVCLLRVCLKRRKDRLPRRLSNDTENAALVSFGKTAFSLPEKKKKNYVDPRNYATTDEALKDFAKEIPPEEIRLEKVIGGGEFGDVCQGWWSRVNQKSPVKVAIKTLKEGSPNKAREDFLTEATIMGQFEDKNVISLFGVVSKSEPVMIVMEFMSHGSLEHYLKKNDGLLNTHRLAKMAAGVASGMKYLAGIGFVHRDLAARNILVDMEEICKISDFGLSRETEENVYNVKTGGKIPVRWTPPEAIHFRKFSEKSDVWSFGVLLWEVMSYGSQPYADWGNQQVLRDVDKGYRLPCPQGCPDCLYEVMLKCWDKDDKARPRFVEIKEELEDLYLNDFTGRTKPPRKREPVRGPMDFSSLGDWLEALKMEQYLENFQNAGLVLKECCELSKDDLVTIGVVLPGHQHKIMSSVTSGKTQDTSLDDSSE